MNPFDSTLNSRILIEILIFTCLITKAYPAVIVRNKYLPLEVFNTDEVASQRLKNMASLEQYQLEKDEYKDQLKEVTITPTITQKTKKLVKPKFQQKENEANGREVEVVNTKDKLFKEDCVNLSKQKCDVKESNAVQNNQVIKAQIDKINNNEPLSSDYQQDFKDPKEDDLVTEKLINKMETRSATTLHSKINDETVNVPLSQTESVNLQNEDEHFTDAFMFDESMLEVNNISNRDIKDCIKQNKILINVKPDLPELIEDKNITIEPFKHNIDADMQTIDKPIIINSQNADEPSKVDKNVNEILLTLKNNLSLENLESPQKTFKFSEQTTIPNIETNLDKEMNREIRDPTKYDENESTLGKKDDSEHINIEVLVVPSNNYLGKTSQLKQEINDINQPQKCLNSFSEEELLANYKTNEHCGLRSQESTDTLDKSPKCNAETDLENKPIVIKPKQSVTGFTNNLLLEIKNPLEQTKNNLKNEIKRENNIDEILIMKDSNNCNQITVPNHSIVMKDVENEDPDIIDNKLQEYHDKDNVYVQQEPEGSLNEIEQRNLIEINPIQTKSIDSITSSEENSLIQPISLLSIDNPENVNISDIKYISQLPNINHGIRQAREISKKVNKSKNKDILFEISESTPVCVQKNKNNAHTFSGLNYSIKDPSVIKQSKNEVSFEKKIESKLNKKTPEVNDLENEDVIYLDDCLNKETEDNLNQLFFYQDSSAKEPRITMKKTQNHDTYENETGDNVQEILDLINKMLQDQNQKNYKQETPLIENYKQEEIPSNENTITLILPKIKELMERNQEVDFENALMNQINKDSESEQKLSELLLIVNNMLKNINEPMYSENKHKVSLTSCNEIAIDNISSPPIHYSFLK